MKNAKRILIAILAIALVSSVFAFSVSAENEVNFRGEGIKEFDDILEYYLYENFIDLDFTESEWDAKVETAEYVKEFWKDKEHTSSTTSHYPRIGSAAVVDPDNSENMIYSAGLPYGKGAGFNVAASKSASVIAEQVMIAFDIKFEDSCIDNMYYDVEMYLPNGSSAQVLRFDFTSKEVGTPVIQYAAWDAEIGAFDNVRNTVEGLVPTTGVWYCIEICFNAATDTFYINIAEEGKEPVRIESEIPGAVGIKEIDMFGKFSNTGVFNCKNAKTHNANVANFANLTEADSAYACGAGKCRASVCAEFHIDDLRVYEGSFARNSDKFEITKTTLEDFRTFYQSGTLTFEQKFALAQTLDQLYSLDSTVFPEEVSSVLPEGPGYVNEIYAAETVTRANGLDKNADYYARYDYAHNYILMYDFLPADDELAALPGMTEELVAALVAARKAVADEKAELAVIKEHSESFIAYIHTYDPEVKDYYALNAFYDQAISDIYAKRALEYEGMAECTAIYEELVERVLTMNADVYEFVNHVETMEFAASFGYLYAAYVDATESFYKYGEPGVINPGLDNASHPDVQPKIDYYLLKAPFIQAKAKECDDFIAIIDEAKNTSYYTSLVGKLEEAVPYLDLIQNDYPGIAESLALYYALGESVVNAENASEAYIAAVKAIEGKTEFYTKKAAVEAAAVLKAHGDVLGYEGVKEANIALAEAEADIYFREGSSTTLISLVDQIKAAKTLSEKRTLIRLATVHAAGADEGYKGVTDAKAALADAVKAFEAAVNQANKGVTDANKVALNVVNTVDGATIFH